MTRLVGTISLLAVSLISINARADHHHKEWMKFFVGEWTYEWSAAVGEFSEKGELKTTRIVKGSGLLVRITTANGDKEVEVSGWQSDRNAFGLLGYSSNGGYWNIDYTDVGAKQMSGPGRGILPDGRKWEGRMTLTRKDDNNYEIKFEGTAAGEKLVSLSKTTRKKKAD